MTPADREVLMFEMKETSLRHGREKTGCQLRIANVQRKY